MPENFLTCEADKTKEDTHNKTFEADRQISIQYDSCFQQRPNLPA